MKSEHITLAQLDEVGDGSDGPVKAAHVTAELAARYRGGGKER